jgi:hypothetical protein
VVVVGAGREGPQLVAVRSSFQGPLTIFTSPSSTIEANGVGAHSLSPVGGQALSM